MKNPRITLLAYLDNKAYESLPELTRNKIEAAMFEYSLVALENFKQNEIKKAIRFSFLGIPKLCYKNIMYAVRMISLNLHIKQAVLMCKLENRKVYVVRQSLFGYKLMTSLDMKYNKKIGLIKRSATHINRKEWADFTADPNEINK